MKALESIGRIGIGFLVACAVLGPLAGKAYSACANPLALAQDVLGTATGTATAGANLVFDASGSGYVSAAGENLITLSQLFPNGQGERAITGQVTARASGQVAMEWRRIINNQEKVVAIGVNAAGKLFFAVRSNGAAALSVVEGPAVTIPIWLKLNRIGGTIAGYYSADGNTWNQLSVAGDVVGATSGQAYASFTASGQSTIGEACLDVAVKVPKYPVPACTTPNPAVTKATFSILSDDKAEVFINGYYVGETSDHQFETPIVLNVNTCFLAGGLRLIAVKNYDNQDNMMGVSYKLDIENADGTRKVYTSNASEGVKYVYEGNSSGRGDREPYNPVAKDAAGNAWYHPDFVPDARWQPAVNFPAGCEATLGHIDPSIPWISYPKTPCPAANAGNEMSFRQFYDIPLVTHSFTFTDEAGKGLAAGDYWSPAKGKLYLAYTDDYVSAADLPKVFKLSIRNRRGLALPDSETITVQAHVKQNGATGLWKAEIVLAESRTPGKLNGTAETLVLGEITATVTNHNNVGAPDGSVATASLKVAYPDQPAVVRIQDAADPAAEVGRFTSPLLIRIQDQSLSVLPNDTLWAQVTCAGTPDRIAKLALAETAPGEYRSAPVTKNEGGAGAASPADAILTCAVSDKITVTYVDEVHGTAGSAEAAWDGSKEGAFRYTAVDTGMTITSARDGTGGNAFQIVVKGATPTPGAPDEINLTLTTGSAPADVETVKLRETSANSGVFTASTPVVFAFITGASAPVSGNGTVEAVRDGSDPDAGVILKGEVSLNGTLLKQNLLLLPAPIPPVPPNPVTSAYIKDLDGDGAGDHVYLVFTRKLDDLPATLGPVFWNAEGPAFANRQAPKITFLDGTGQGTVAADFSDAPFPNGLTGIASGAAPYATLPATGVFAGQKPVLADSMGAVIVKASISLADAGDTAAARHRDTLRVTLSEPLAAADWAGLFRFGSAPNGKCTDYAGSRPVVVSGAPALASDGMTYTVLVLDDPANRTPFTGDCMYLETGKGYTDAHGNRPPEHGLRLEGPKARKVFMVLQGYPPIAGFGASTVPGNAGTFIGWIPPVGYVPGTTFRESQLPVPGSQPVGTDMTGSIPLDPAIATVQIIANRKYIARVSIFDNLGNRVREFSQSFGYRGELANPARHAGSRGWTGYLVWDLRDQKGAQAGQGVYIWNILLEYEDGTRAVRLLRTGVLRK